ncbi:hypothetical protein [Larkinella terrae]|uniref:Glycosyl hydrolase family 76 n=1 Tax=Larkinella terrae TaxID=2025311 RepID=A0A7K0EG89_9BACT|nr:hypothetical protein [Larkinella terrae]MRS60785.1 hypothetical protein [Larkinella terrae]
MKITPTLFLLSFLFSPLCRAQKKDYLYYVKTHCDQLIDRGKDQYGRQKSNMLASVIDTRDMSIPKENVTPTEGTRPSDRAVGGSNFYHDVELVKVLKELTALTGNQRYTTALNQYARDFMTYSQNPLTGLLGWGEHIYYNFYADTVMEGSDPLGKYKSHEFIESTPPWAFLWEIDSAATRKAIAGVRYHFRSGVTQSFLYNRHARWHKADKPEYRGLEQYQDGGQAWIKHSGLQCYSFTFLYGKTGNPEWKRWSEGTGNLFWKFRNPETNLTISCVDDPRPSGVNASLPGASLLAYYLLKSSQNHPDFAHFREKAETFLKAIEKYSWDEQRKGYYSEVALDGKVADPTLIQVINTGYGAADILLVGRVAAYFYKVTGDPVYRNMVRKAATLVAAQAWPDTFVMNSLANALQFTLDAAEVLNDKQLVQHAHKLGNIGIQKLWSGKLFVRQPQDPYYESKLGANEFVSGLLRLHLLENNQPARASLLNWAF